MTFRADNDRDRVLQATDLVALIGEHVQLHRKGREHVGLCPFHDDHTPSMHVVTHKDAHFFKCFACGESGSAIDFVMKYHAMSFLDSLRLLADRAGIELQPREGRSRSDQEHSTASDRDELIKACAFADAYFRQALAHPEAGAAARRILDERGIAGDVVEQFGIGFAPAAWEGLRHLVERKGLSIPAFRSAGLLREGSNGLRDTFVNRLIFPIHDQLGRPIAFGGRRIDPETQPKYINSPETPLFDKSRTLFGLHRAQRAILQERRAIVAEGYTDVVALHQAGISNSVATLGTALTLEHAQVLQRFCDAVILLFDGDEAGYKAADRAIEIFFKRDVDVRICILPDGHDPDDLLRLDDGRERLDAAIGSASDVVDFLAADLRRRIGRSDSISGRERIVRECAMRLGSLGYRQMSGIKKRAFATKLSDAAGLSIPEFESMIPAERRQPAPDAPAAQATPEPSFRTVPADRARAERDLLGVLLYHPPCIATPVDVADGHNLPIDEAFSSESFADPECRSVFARIFRAVEGGGAFSVNGLCSEDDELRGFVTDLFLHGRELCRDDVSLADTKLRESVSAFTDVLDRGELRETVLRIRRASVDDGTNDASRLLRVIEQRRMHRDDLAVLPRADRVRQSMS